MSKLKAKSDWLKSTFTSPVAGVDRDNCVIRSYVVAQEGLFKSEGRGRFSKDSLTRIVELLAAAPGGLKSRFTHPTLSGDGLGTFLGRVRNPAIGTVDKDGKSIGAVRADLHLDPTSFKTPNGDLGTYVMDLAESDPDAMSSSLVLKKQDVFELDKNGKRVKDSDGNELPAIWMPTELHASDIVDTGDAVDGFLAVEGFRDGVVRRATELLSEQFPDEDRETVRARCLGWLDRYLDYRFGQVEKNDESRREKNDLLERQLELAEIS